MFSRCQQRGNSSPRKLGAGDGINLLLAADYKNLNDTDEVKDLLYKKLDKAYIKVPLYGMKLVTSTLQWVKKTSTGGL